LALGKTRLGQLFDEASEQWCECLTLGLGAVVHGPASVPQTRYEVRLQNGQVEVRHLIPG
jgi:hypothetical protein